MLRGVQGVLGSYLGAMCSQARLSISVQVRLCPHPIHTRASFGDRVCSLHLRRASHKNYFQAETKHQHSQKRPRASVTLMRSRKIVVG